MRIEYRVNPFGASRMQNLFYVKKSRLIKDKEERKSFADVLRKEKERQRDLGFSRILNAERRFLRQAIVFR